MPLALTLRRLVPLLLLGAAPATAQAPVELRYRLSPGDRLVYKEVFEKEGKSATTTFHSRTELSNQVMALDSVAGSALVGVQRNRLSAELLEFHENGRDTLARQKPAFLQRLATRPVRFADANLFSATGQELLAPQVLREANSKLLYRIGEIMPLPATAVQAGSEWDSGVFGLHMKLEMFENVDGERCAVISDTGNRKETHLQFTFCLASGRLVKLDFAGQYQEFESTIHERVTLDLEHTYSHETSDSWLNHSDTRVGALTAYLASKAPMPPATALNEVLQSGTHDAQALVLALYYQRRQTPDSQVLAPLLQSSDQEVRRIANRFTQAPPKAASQPCELPTVTHKREKAGTTLRGMSSPERPSAPYIMHVPLDYRGDQPFPLLIYLSGGGGLAFDAAQNTGNDFKHAGYLMVFPHAGGDLWWLSKPTEMVHALLLEILRTYNVDTNRVYLAGFSNGGTGALEYGVRWPDRFAAVASLMGAGLDTPSGTKLPLQNVLDVPVLFVHGEKDPRIPPSASYNTQAALRNLKPRVSPELHILKGRVHDVTLANDDDFTQPFLSRYTREPFPAAVNAAFLDPRYLRQYWVEVVEGDKGEASVEARILEGNLIDIDTKHLRKLRLLLRPELFPTSAPLRIRLNGKEQPAIELKRDCQLFQRSAQDYADPFLAFTDEVVLNVAQ